MMETVSFKLQKDILSKIDGVLEPLNFSNRTEFIRESVREKLNSIEKDLILLELKKFKGSAKTSVSDVALHKIREDIAKRYAKDLGVNLD